VAALSAIIRERQPDAIYLEYFDSLASSRPPLATLTAESPLYAPHREHFHHIFRSKHTTPGLYELCCDMRELTDLTLNSLSDTDCNKAPTQEKAKELLERVQRLPAIPATASPPDQIYESCRLASLIYSTAIVHHISFSAAADMYPAQPQPLTVLLEQALRRSDPSSCWDRLAGVMLWVVCVGAAAARGRRERRWLVTMAMRCSVLMAFEYGEAVLGGMRRLVGVMGLWAGSSVAVE